MQIQLEKHSKLTFTIALALLLLLPLTFFMGFRIGVNSSMLAAVSATAPSPFTLLPLTATCKNNLPIVAISWTISKNADRYSIQRKVGNDTTTVGFSGEILSQIKSTTTTDSQFTTTYGRTSHSYRVIAKGSALTYSNAMTIVLPECKNTSTPPPPPLPANVLPTATITAPSWAVTSIYLSSSMNFQGSGRDSDGSVSGYEWRDGSCAAGTLLSSSSSFSKSDFTVGSHTIFFRVKDNAGVWSTNCPSRVVTIAQPANIIPTATIINPTNTTTSEKNKGVIFSGLGADIDGVVSGYEWIEGTCTAGTLLSATSSFSKSDFSIGGHTVFLRVKDNAGAWSTNCPSRIVNVVLPANILPTASISLPTQVTTSTYLASSVSFAGSGIDTDGVISENEWRENACDTGTLLSGTASFSIASLSLGTHTIYFRVKDDRGGWSTNCPSRTVNIVAPAPTPVAATFPSWMTWGASVGWQDSAMSQFESLVGKQPQMEAVFAHWGNDQFPSFYAPRIRDKGRTMVIFWEAVDYNRPYFSQPEYGFDAVNSGSLDAYFTKFATDAKAYNGPIILAPFSEFNGNWFPWGMTVQGNTPAKFISAWIHIRNIFTTVGATNVQFAWVPNNDAVPDTAANKFELNYPGSQYVDIVGIDAFNSSPWESFDQMVGGELARLKQYNKPTYILSLGVQADSRKAQWITDSFTRDMYKYPELKGWIWFNENKEHDWRVNSSADSLAAFKGMLP
jgi:hypothetical protein